MSRRHPRHALARRLVPSGWGQSVHLTHESVSSSSPRIPCSRCLDRLHVEDAIRVVLDKEAGWSGFVHKNVDDCSPEGIAKSRRLASRTWALDALAKYD